MKEVVVLDHLLIVVVLNPLRDKYMLSNIEMD